MAYLFDEMQGLSQLEALDMLSRECVHKMKYIIVAKSCCSKKLLEFS